MAAAVMGASLVAAAARGGEAKGSAAAAEAMAARLMGMAMSDGRAYALAESLSDGVGPRQAGSAGAAQAVTWAVEKMRALGFKNVHTEPVRVPRWIRGVAEAELVAPTRQEIHLTALGPSVGTGPNGITADVVEVAGFEELKALGDGARGKIVLFNPRPMVRGRTFEEYGRAVAVRSGGAVAAAKAGALAALVRSAGTGEYRLPHTGGMHYDEATPKIPAAAVSAEDAELIKRLINSGGGGGAGHARVRMKLVMTPRFDGEVESANVIGEVPGRDRAGEIVLLGAHLDSWDLATGAIDDAAGCGIVMDAARIIASVGRAPRRTVRVVLFMNEEMGLSGARAYAAAHAGELGRHVAAVEVDSGEGRPSGFGVVGAGGVPLLRRIAAPLATIGASSVMEASDPGADLMPMGGKVPLFNIDQDLTTYFDWHHTAADTFDKVDAMDMAFNTAAIAVVAYGLADAGETLPVVAPARRGGGMAPPASAPAAGSGAAISPGAPAK
ncbi:MAG TPA: M28 family peptidase [Polyangia bacterium]|nr:M28 family peptidase [Polyangia bacterium]